MTIGIEAEIDAILRASLPERREAALSHARELGRRLEYLTWHDRAKLLDEFLWTEAKSALPTEVVTAVINRHSQVFDSSHPSRTYAAWCAPLLTAVLLVLDETGPVHAPEQALTYLLSQHHAHQDAAMAWIAEAQATAQLQQLMACLPGYAFLLLTVCPNDTAESFMARDAFWSAMLG